MNSDSYSVFQGFRQAKSANAASILSSRQFLILPKLPQKMKLTSKVVKVDLKIIISLKLTVGNTEKADLFTNVLERKTNQYPMGTNHTSDLNSFLY
jgi:hypothetical protein